MTDLTKLTTPFGLLDAATQKALREWPHGVECYQTTGNWCPIPSTFGFATINTYRARPAPVVPDSINWDHVAPEWKWMARDKGGIAFLYVEKPDLVETGWEYVFGFHQVTAFASYQRGTCDWKDSLVERPA